MESINSFFTGFNDKNIFATYPSEYSQKQKPVSAFCSKDLFVGNKTDDVNKEIAMYLDILYKDTDEELLKKTDKLKLNSAYLPMKCQTIQKDGFYLWKSTNSRAIAVAFS